MYKSSHKCFSIGIILFIFTEREVKQFAQGYVTVGELSCNLSQAPNPTLFLHGIPDHFSSSLSSSNFSLINSPIILLPGPCCFSLWRMQFYRWFGGISPRHATRAYRVLFHRNNRRNSLKMRHSGCLFKRSHWGHFHQLGFKVPCLFPCTRNTSLGMTLSFMTLNGKQTDISNLITWSIQAS